VPVALFALQALNLVIFGGFAGLLLVFVFIPLFAFIPVVAFAAASSSSPAGALAAPERFSADFTLPPAGFLSFRRLHRRRIGRANLNVP
jgi:hypothetical protein